MRSHNWIQERSNYFSRRNTAMHFFSAKIQNFFNSWWCCKLNCYILYHNCTILSYFVHAMLKKLTANWNNCNNFIHFNNMIITNAACIGKNAMVSHKHTHNSETQGSKKTNWLELAICLHFEDATIQWWIKNAHQMCFCFLKFFNIRRCYNLNCLYFIVIVQCCHI